MSTNPFEMSEDQKTALAEMEEGDEELEVSAEEATEEVVIEEQITEEQGEVEKAKPKVKTVPHQALHAERAERKKAEDRARNLEAQFAQLNERLRQAAEADIPPPPNPDEDPIAAIHYERQRREALEQQAAERQRQDQQVAQQRQYEQQVLNYANESISEFRSEQPAYDEAVSYLEKVRSDELALFGLNPQQISQQIHAEAMNLAGHCAQRGASVAETIFRMAEVRGFRPKADTSQAEEKIKTLSAGQERQKTLSGTGGKSSGAEMTVEGLLKMPADEFDAWTRKNPAKAKALMGG